VDPQIQRLIFSPSDLLRDGKTLATPIRVGGRVEWITDEQLLLADAIGSLKLRCETELVRRLTLGALAVVKVKQQSGQLVVVAVEQVDAFAPPRGDSEWARLVWSGKAKRLVALDRARQAIRHWFNERAFVETETPSRLKAPGLDSDVEPVAAEDGWLVTSPELCMKRLLVAGMPRIFQFAKCFRRGELGPRHEPEFTMLEWYRGFSDLEQILDDTEELVMTAAAAVGAGQKIEHEGRQVVLERPFLRLTVAEAFRRHAGISAVDVLAREHRQRYFQLFVDQVEPSLAEYERPVFLHAYPASEAALARLNPQDPRWAERAELYVAGVELCNGYSELSDPVEQRARFEAELKRRASEGSPVYPLDEAFLSALEQGMPHSAGNALGFDRLMMLLVGCSAIDQVVAFPRNQV